MNFPLNAFYSVPAIFGGPSNCQPNPNNCSGPSQTWCPPDHCDPCKPTELNPGNGFCPVHQGATHAVSVALVAVQPFQLVVVSIGGVALADNSVPTNANTLFAITLASASAGSTVPIAFAGIITNPITGIGGWGWTIGAPIYLSTVGNLTQTKPNSGFVCVVGQAISSNAISFFPRGQYGTNDIFPRIVPVTTGTTVVVNSANTEIADITVLSSSNIGILPGYDGQRITLRIQQNSSGTSVVTWASNVIPTVFMLNTTSLSVSAVTFMYAAISMTWVQI